MRFTKSKRKKTVFRATKPAIPDKLVASVYRSTNEHMKGYIIKLERNLTSW